MKTQTVVRVLLILLLLVSAAVPGLAASFSAELVDTRGGRTATGTFYSQDRSYRFDLGENGQRLIIMVDGQTGSMRVLNPSENAY